MSESPSQGQDQLVIDAPSGAVLAGGFDGVAGTGHANLAGLSR